jgi:hypothetical protein
LETVCRLTNEVLKKKGLKSCTSVDFFAYIGLELGMSFLKSNSIKSYWGNGSFMGHETYKQCMPRNCFEQIRASVWFCSMNSYNSEMASSDPLWFCRSLLDQFIKKSASVAVPVGVTALDENSCPTKAHCKAKTYSPNKPAKYAIRFYAIVGHKYCYLSSMFDNRAGNSTGIDGVHDYCCLFRTLRTPYYNVMGNDTSKDSLANTPSSLWVCMMGHQSSLYKQPNGAKRSDNFYTWYTVAEVLKKLTDGKAHFIGTVKFTNVDATNRYYLSKGMELLKNADRGRWCLVQAFHKHPDYEKLQNQHTTNMPRQGSSSNAATSFIPPPDNPAKNCGYIVSKIAR